MHFSKCLGHWPVLPAKYIAGVAFAVLACVIPLSAQEPQELTPPKVEGKVTFGSAVFNEDIEHKAVGGAIRVYLTRRLVSSRSTSICATGRGIRITSFRRVLRTTSLIQLNDSLLMVWRASESYTTKAGFSEMIL